MVGFLQHTLHECAGIWLATSRERQSCGMGRCRHDSMTFFNHAVCCNKWMCPGQQRGSCENTSRGDGADATGDEELCYSRGMVCSYPAASGLGSPTRLSR